MTPETAEPQSNEVRDVAGLAGHPSGLTPLFFTEMWERFSYYGMRAILVLFMVASPEKGGLGFDTKHAASIYGTYTMSAYLASIPGGLIADRWLGARWAVLIGGIIIACGHFSMIFQSLPSFYAGLALIVIGTGFLKPNISTMVGSLYPQNDPRRDGGFSLFYMGINIGAMAAPLVCGFLAQSENFQNTLRSMNMNPSTSWHWGFGAAGIGMILGLIVYVGLGNRIKHVGNVVRKNKLDGSAAPSAVPLTSEDWKRIGAVFVFFLFATLFWAAYEQKGISLNLFANRLVRTEIFGWKYPASWLQSLTAFFIILLAPIFSALWVKLGDRQPSIPTKFTLGMLFIGLAFMLLVPASAFTMSGLVSPLWLVGLYFLEVVGEMCLSPVGLSAVTKLAPARLLGILMGVWFLASSIGSKLAGFIGGHFDAAQPMVQLKMYASISATLLIAAGLLALLTPRIQKMMGSIR